MFQFDKDGTLTLPSVSKVGLLKRIFQEEPGFIIRDKESGEVYASGSTSEEAWAEAVRKSTED